MCSASSLSSSLVATISFKPKSSPTSSLSAGMTCIGYSTGTLSHQSPTLSWEKQPAFHLIPASRSCSNTRKALPENRKDFPLRFNCAALKGIQPSARRDPRLLRQRSLVFLNCLRRVANSALILWIVPEPIRSKYSVEPAVSLSRSYADSHFGAPAKGRAALALVSFAKFQI